MIKANSTHNSQFLSKNGSLKTNALGNSLTANEQIKVLKAEVRKGKKKVKKSKNQRLKNSVVFVCRPSEAEQSQIFRYMLEAVSEKQGQIDKLKKELEKLREEGYGN